tara:strand:+ start:2079 stop:3710 length:1632 start_codon:yes stop_codon:yes gene_type:complete
MKYYGFYLVIIISGIINSQNFHYHEDDWYVLKNPNTINAIAEDNFNIYFATDNGIFQYNKIMEDFKYSYLLSSQFKFTQIRHMIYDSYRDYFWVIHTNGIHYKSSVSSIWQEMLLYNSGIFSYYEIDDIGISPEFIWLRSISEIYPFNPFTAKLVSLEDAYNDIESIQWGYSQFGDAGNNIDISPFSIDGEWAINFNTITNKDGQNIATTIYMKDDNRNHWFGTNVGYILKGVPYSYRLDLLKIGLPFDHVTTSYQDKEGNWWFGDSRYKRTGEGISSFNNMASDTPFIAQWDEESNEWTYYNSKRLKYFKNTDINTILRLGSTVYFGTMAGLLFLDLLTEEWNIIDNTHGLNDSAIWDIIEYNNSLYVATVKGINEISIINHSVIPNENDSYKLLYEYNIYDMDADSNYLYLSTSNGLFQMNWTTKKLTIISKKELKKIKIFNNSIYGTDDILWHIEKGKEEKYITSDVHDFDICSSYIWSSKKDKAVLLDTRTLQEWEYTQIDGIPGKNIYSINCDQEWVWFLTNEGAAFYNWKQYHNENK